MPRAIGGPSWLLVRLKHGQKRRDRLFIHPRRLPLGAPDGGERERSGGADERGEKEAR